MAKEYYFLIRTKKLPKETRINLAEDVEVALDYDDFRVFFHHQNTVALVKKEEFTKVIEVLKKYKVGATIKRKRK